MFRICRFIKRGPGAILGMVLLVVVGIAACTWYRVNVVWERIAPEQAARAYVQMIVDGDFETWDELNPPDPVWCHNGRCIMTLTEVSAQREQGPQLIDLSVRPTYSSTRYEADVRFDVGGEERSYSMILTRGGYRLGPDGMVEGQAGTRGHDRGLGRPGDLVGHPHRWTNLHPA